MATRTRPSVVAMTHRFQTYSPFAREQSDPADSAPRRSKAFAPHSASAGDGENVVGAARMRRIFPVGRARRPSARSRRPARTASYRIPASPLFAARRTSMSTSFSCRRENRAPAAGDERSGIINRQRNHRATPLGPPILCDDSIRGSRSRRNLDLNAADPARIDANTPGGGGGGACAFTIARDSAIGG